ncbi:MAG: hypothetical protein CL674_04265 [Bdellovibrionaceae bacterium]|nr:hypothetical protein [Pseudobdellovibrionaceae bacterium]
MGSFFLVNKLRDSIQFHRTGIAFLRFLSVLVFSICFVQSSEATEINSTWSQCRTSIKKSVKEVSKLRQKLRIQLDYSKLYNVSKFFGLNYLGFVLSGWPLWYFPEVHSYYKNHLSYDQKRQIDEILNQPKNKVEPTNLEPALTSIRSWKQAKKIYLFLLGLVSSGMALDHFLDYIPYSYLVEGRDGLVELKVDRITQDYLEKYQQELSPEYKSYLADLERDKKLWRLLIEIYKDKKGENNEN